MSQIFNNNANIVKLNLLNYLNKDLMWVILGFLNTKDVYNMVLVNRELCDLAEEALQLRVRFKGQDFHRFIKYLLCGKIKWNVDELTVVGDYIGSRSKQNLSVALRETVKLNSLIINYSKCGDLLSSCIPQALLVNKSIISLNLKGICIDLVELMYSISNFI